jgi:hypothetical protein
MEPLGNFGLQTFRAVIRDVCFTTDGFRGGPLRVRNCRPQRLPVGLLVVALSV